MQSREDDDDEPMDTTPSPSLLQSFLQPPSGRKGSKKVRSGCITCKIRKVKCDEAKPYCTRCTRTGRKCDGYLDASALAIRRRRRRRSTNTNPDTGQDESTPSKPQLGTDQQYLANLSAADKRRGEAASSETSLLSPSRSLSAWAASAQEQHAFGFFQNTTAPCLAGDLDAVFWRVLVLQVCHSEPAVRHAVLAMSSLHEVFLRPPPSSRTASALPSDTRLVHEFALQQYNKAIAHMLDDMKCEATSSDDDDDDDNDDDDDDGDAKDCGSCFQDAKQNIAGPALQRPVAPLMTCILFLCIEAMQGKDKEALLHLEQGRHILSQLGDGRAAADNGQRKTKRPKRPGLAGSSAEMAVVKQHLVPLYTRLSLTSFLFGGCPAPIPRSLKTPPSTAASAAQPVPDTFASIHDLRTSVHDFLDAVLRFTARARPSKYPRSGTSPSPTPSPAPTSAPAHYAPPSPGSATSTPARSTSTCAVLTTLEVEQKTLAAQLRRLRIALSLFRINKPPTSTAPLDAKSVPINSNAAALTLLQIHLCSAEIWLATATTRAEAAFDAHVETFSTVVSLAATILDAERQQQQQKQTPVPCTNVFALETHILPALYFVATKCRHGPVRHAALSMLLANAGRRENLWRADVLGAVAARIVAIEEGPEGARRVKSEDDDNGDGGSNESYHHYENSQDEFRPMPHEPTPGAGLYSVSYPWFATSQDMSSDLSGIYSPDIQDWPGTVPTESTGSDMGLFSVLSTAGSIDSSFLADDLFYLREASLPAVHESAQSEAATLPALLLSPPTPTTSGTASTVAATKLWSPARAASGSSGPDLQSASSVFDTKSDSPSPSPSFNGRRLSEVSEGMPPSTDAPFGIPEPARVHVAMIGLGEAKGRWLTLFRKLNGLDGAWDVRSEFVDVAG